MSRHGENIRKRKDGRWEARYIVGHKENGKAQYQSIFRENCYRCEYARRERVSDLTIGDFWGLNLMQVINDYDGNISCVLANTKKGLEFFNIEKEGFVFEERDVIEAIRGNDNLRHPSERTSERDLFCNAYRKKGFQYAASKNHYVKEIKRVKINGWIKKVLGLKR